jgi:stress-induced morphogen
MTFGAQRDGTLHDGKIDGRHNSINFDDMTRLNQEQLSFMEKKRRSTVETKLQKSRSDQSNRSFNSKSSKRYSHVDDQPSSMSDKEESEKPHSNANKPQFFAIQINSPSEENQAQIVEHLFVPSALNEIISIKEEGEESGPDDFPYEANEGECRFVLAKE